jgi:hypothetical protein
VTVTFGESVWFVTVEGGMVDPGTKPGIPVVVVTLIVVVVVDVLVVSTTESPGDVDGTVVGGAFTTFTASE